MDENYYRELIDKVTRNEEEMWGRSEDSDEGFDDFEKLWDIMGDEEADISAETYFDAMDICLTSFFGSSKDHKVVWENIANHYKQALDDPDDEEEFRDAFISFAETYIENEDPDCVAQFSKIMHLAINAEDSEMANAVMNCAFCPELWNSEEEYPEWSVWFAVFSDKYFSEIPHTQKVTVAINELYSKLGNAPEMDRLRDLYEEYFGNCINS